MVPKRREYMFFGSIVASDYYAYGPSAEQSLRQSCCIYREHINQNQIWCLNRREYMFFGSIVGSDYYAYGPSAESPLVNNWVLTGNTVQ